MSLVDAPHLFRLSNDLNEVPALRDLFARACGDAGVAEEEMQKGMLLLTELLNNSIEHGCKSPSDCVEGWYRITSSEIVVEVTDPGEVLTAQDFKDSDPADFAETGRGAGMFLVQALSDELDVSRAAAGGTTVRILMRRGQAAAS